MLPFLLLSSIPCFQPHLTYNHWIPSPITFLILKWGEGDDICSVQISKDATYIWLRRRWKQRGKKPED